MLRQYAPGKEEGGERRGEVVKARRDGIRYSILRLVMNGQRRGVPINTVQSFLSGLGVRRVPYRTRCLS
jgi:hypothetical protein